MKRFGFSNTFKGNASFVILIEMDWRQDTGEDRKRHRYTDWGNNVLKRKTKIE